MNVCQIYNPTSCDIDTRIKVLEPSNQSTSTPTPSYGHPTSTDAGQFSLYDTTLCQKVEIPSPNTSYGNHSINTKTELLPYSDSTFLDLDPLKVFSEPDLTLEQNIKNNITTNSSLSSKLQGLYAAAGTLYFGSNPNLNEHLLNINGNLRYQLGCCLGVIFALAFAGFAFWSFFYKENPNYDGTNQRFIRRD
jgi:hypothetical protein